MAEVLKRQLAACQAIGTYLPGRRLRADTHLQQIVAGTGARAGRTFDAVALLASKGRTPQAAMLCRSLFEDMAVAHWLVLHESDPEFLIQRFRSQKDAIRLYNETQRVRYGQDPVEDISDLAGREQELLNTFGSHARNDWWGVRRDGGKIGLPDVVRELAQADRFKPRFANERPILEEMFHSAQKWNNQQLHHTALGLYLRLGCSGQPPVAEPQPHPAVVLSQGYWVYGQMAHLVLDVIPNLDASATCEFERIFRAGLSDAFVGVRDQAVNSETETDVTRNA